MGAFKGEFDNSIDAKGRIAVPARLRALLPEESPNTVVLTRDFETCIRVHTEPDWMQIEAQVNALDQYLQTTRDFRRYFMAPAETQEMDKQGRITLPPSLRRHAGIEPGTTVRVLGVGPYFEIWNPDVLEAHMAKRTKQDYADLAEDVMAPPPIPPALFG